MSSQSTKEHNEDAPQSVEEAGALLGAAITKLHLGGAASTSKHTSPPKGMHSSFATVSPVPSSELFMRLHSLRALMRSVPKDQLPLVAAPSLLAVLVKLLRISSSVATTILTASPRNDSSHAGQQQHTVTPPMLSTPIRTLWADCVVLCCELGEGLTGTARMDTLAFLRTLLNLASTNPKSNKAAGGTRVAALQVVSGLFACEKLSPKLAPWAPDVLSLCHKGLKSSGQYEPSHRVEATRCACSILIACRTVALKKRQKQHGDNGPTFILPNTMEEKALTELTKMLKHATTDKFPEVRVAAANLASLAAPLLMAHSSSSSGGAETPPTLILDEVMTLALRNIDDEMTGVATQWTEAVARCMCTAIQYGEQLRASEHSQRSGDREEGPDAAPADSAPTASRFGGGRSKSLTVSQQCSSLIPAIHFLVERFVKAGGELAASRCGGTFSTGGRAVRVGLSLALMKLLQLQVKFGNVGQGSDVSMEDIIVTMLNMVGPDLEKQIQTTPEGLETGPSPAQSEGRLFGSGRNKSHADAGLARLATNRVLREGLSEVSAEAVQLVILRKLIAICQMEESAATEEGGENESTSQTNGHQLQVILIEISHLITTLGEAAAACLEDLIPVLKSRLSHPIRGVRHEAAIACAAVAGPFPSAARKLLRSSIDEIQVHHAELVKLANLGDELDEMINPRRRRFRKSPTKHVPHPSLAHQDSVHGHCLMVSILLRELPHLPGGLPTDMLMSGLSVAEILVNCQHNHVMAKANVVATCTCVRAGYGIICGALTVGAQSITPHVPLIFDLWEKVGNGAKAKNVHFTEENEVVCFDAAVSSAVAFLKHCPELLLALPQALSKVTLLLEQLLPLILPEGRLASPPPNPAAMASFDSLRAALMEAFAWLPPGSFPMVADHVFTMAAQIIMASTEAEVTCSLLPTLVNNEDEILDAKTLERSERYGQSGGARDIEENNIALLAEIAHHGERESVLHFQTSTLNRMMSKEKHELRGSEILGMITYDGDHPPAPTPLHEVGTWREPAAPSPCSKVRLIDAAVQSFSATFGLKDGKEQQAAMLMLEALVPPLLAQVARVIGVNTALTEPERRQKAKDDHAAVANITAVLLACLQALPLHESTHDIPIGLGPPWMNKAKDLLLTLLPSASNIVRRAAAEGLALLATLGVTEDAHTLQSVVLHSLDEVMQGNRPDGKPRPIPLAPVSAARAGSLLTLACIQRTTHRIKEEHRARARGRAKSNSSVASDESDALPTVQMLTRLLPSVSCHGLLREAFIVRTYALHSFGLLIAYSQPNNAPLQPEDEHLLKKAMEVVEENFLAAWTAISADFDQGQEAEKLAAGASFLAVLLRLMTFLVPSLEALGPDPNVAHRYSCMATVVLETFGSHPVVFAESMAFFERLSAFQHILPPSLMYLLPTENSLTSCIPFVVEGVSPDHPECFAVSSWTRNGGCLGSIRGIGAATTCARLLAVASIVASAGSQVDMPSILFDLLEHTCGRRTYASETLYRPLAAPRGADAVNNDVVSIESEAIDALNALLLTESNSEGGGDPAMLRWILLSKALLSGVVNVAGNDGTSPLAAVVNDAIHQANVSASRVVDGGQCRWQVKCQATRCGTLALAGIHDRAKKEGLLENSPQFNPQLAKKAFLDASRAQAEESPRTSYLALHLSEVLASACSATIATLDQSELRRVQQGGARFLTELISCFGTVPDPEDADLSILDQFSSQILSSVKQAVTYEDSDDDQTSGQLFAVGCKALQAVVQTKIITDPISLKRLIRPILPGPKEFAYCPYGGDDWLAAFRIVIKNELTFRDQRELLLPRIGKLWTLGKLRELSDNGYLPDEIVTMISEVVQPNRLGVAAHSAAVVIDAARLLKGSGMSLSGMRTKESSDDVSKQSGLLYANLKDIDNHVKAAIVESWPSCACDAAVNFVEAIKTEEDETRRAECTEWLEKLLPTIFCGFLDAISIVTGTTERQRPPEAWACGLEAQEVLVMCMHSIRVLVNGAPGELTTQRADDLSLVVSSVLKSLVLPLVEKSETPKTLPSTELVTEICKFLETVAVAPLDTEELKSSVLRAILSPLDALQKKQIDFTNPFVPEITASCLVAACSSIQRPGAEESLVQAMLQLSLDILSSTEFSNVPDSVATKARTLLGECLNHDEIPTSHREGLAREMADENKWDAWAIVCSHSQAALARSIPVAREALQDPDRQLPALAAIRRVVQETPETTGIVMHGLGAQVLALLKSYGTLTPPTADLSKRTIVCADCMKIIMVAYPTMSEADDKLTLFLSVILEVWTTIIGYNGLPNQASPQPHADASLGRMAAASIVHVARMTPAPFKESMPHLSERGRALLEFSVRAEMSGYAGNANSSAAPAKKKLNLQGFTKQ